MPGLAGRQTPYWPPALPADLGESNTRLGEQREAYFTASTNSATTRISPS
jgi:hypothetical protein